MPRRDAHLAGQARIILKLAEGKMVKDADAELGERPNTAIMRRDEAISRKGLKACRMPREAGGSKSYGDEFRNNLLAKIGTKPPGGLARWDCPALARELKAAENTVWRFLSKEGMHLERQGARRAGSWPGYGSA